MARDSSIWKAITGASFLVVLVLLLIFLYAQSFTPSAIFPEDTINWNKILTGYLVIFALTLIVTSIVARDVVLAMAKANYWRSFLTKFIPSAIFTSIILIILKGILKGIDSINIFQFVAYMPIPVLLVHLFVVSQIEEIMFGGLIYTSIFNRAGHKSANIITIFLFAIWHFAKTGGNWIIMLTYIPLRFSWNYIRNYGTPGLNKWSPNLFGGTPRTQQANAGSHFGFNMFAIGFT